MQTLKSAEEATRSLLVIGGGGHAKVVIDLVLRGKEWKIAGILDDAPAAAGKSVLGCTVLGGTERLRGFAQDGTGFVVAIGSNAARERLQKAASAAGLVPVALVHPAATVAESARIGAGAVVMAGAVINADAVIGDGAIVNTGALVDHDCEIGDYCHIAPGVSLCGTVRVGPRTLIGVGASVLPGVSIGSDCVIGAGAAVLGPVASGARVVGVPARANGK